MSKKPWEMEPEEITGGDDNAVKLTYLGFGIGIGRLTRREAFIISLVWLVLVIAMTVFLLTFYATELPKMIGFESTVLLGVGILVLRSLSD